MTIKASKSELELILFLIHPHTSLDPAKIENKEAIWIYILLEISKKIMKTIMENPSAKSYKIKLRTYQMRAFKELMDRLDFLEIGESDPWQYSVLSMLYDLFPKELKYLDEIGETNILPMAQKTNLPIHFQK